MFFCTIRVRLDLNVDLKKFGAAYGADRPAINGESNGHGSTNNGTPKVTLSAMKPIPQKNIIKK